MTTNPRAKPTPPVARARDAAPGGPTSENDAAIRAPSPPIRVRVAASLFLLAIAIAMLAWTWGRWLDPQIDFGGELYVAWRIDAGDVLYRDLAYFTGPLSPYVNGLWMSLFGVSLRTIVIANLAVLAAIALLLHRLLARVAGALAATAGLAVFLTLFACAQLEPVGNSNYVTPYAHETTHGALIALAALAALERWLATRRLGWIAAAGFAVGLSFLTKVEVFLATSAAVGIGIALGLYARRERSVATLVMVAIAALTPVIAAFALLATALGAQAAWRGTLGAWPYVFDGRITSLAFYARILGNDQPAANFGRMLGSAGRDLAVILPALAVGFAARARSRPRAAVLVAFAGACGLVLALQIAGPTWMEIARAWPLFAALALAGLVATFVRRGARSLERSDHDGEGARTILAIAFAVFALVMLAKMVLNARIQMYGFALAMPATMLVVAALVGWLPAWIERRGGSAALARAAVLGVIAAAVVGHLRWMSVFVERATIPIGREGDSFRAVPRGALLSVALAEIERRARPEARVVVLPEGVMLNYLARRRTPARYINYMPPELLMFGEDAILADFAASPPDLVVFVTKSTAEYGVPFFGRDYGRKIWSWIDAHYVPVFAQQDERVRLEGGIPYGVQILEPR